MQTPKRYIYQSVIDFVAKCILISSIAALPQLATAQALPPTNEVQSELITVESGGPDYLNPVSNTADLNLLAGIFGNIARAAAGQIDLATLAVGDPNTGESTADNILSSIMSVYLTGILAITGIIIVILIGLMTIQSGQEGSVLTKRYNEWVAIRTLYAVFAMMPVVGGWSIGQYAILSGTFFVNTMTNEMNHVASRWVFANGTTNSIDLDPFEYRSIVETVYLNEVCAQINNKTLSDFNLLQDNFINSQIERVASGNLSQATEAGINKSIEWLTYRANQYDQAQNQIQLVRAESLNDSNEYYRTYKWSSTALGDSICGEIIIDFNTFKSPNIEINNSRINSYFLAQTEAMDRLTDQVKNEIATVVNAVSLINQDVSILNKEERERRLKEEASNNKIFAAFSFAFDAVAEFYPLSFDDVLAEKVAEYRDSVSRAYRAENAEYAQLFDEMLNDIAIRQRQGNPANYESIYERTVQSLPEQYNMVAGPEIQAMLANTSRGWVFAGYKWWDLSKAQTTQVALQSNAPKVMPYTGYMTGISDIARSNIDRFTNTYIQSNNARIFSDFEMNIDGERLIPNPGSIEGVKRFASLSNFTEAFSSFHSELGPWLTQQLTSAFLEDFESTDLLTNLQSAGHKYLLIGQGLMLAGVTLPVVASAAETGGGMAAKVLTLGTSEVLGKTAGAIFRGAAKILTYAAAIFLMVGFVYAIYLPLLPAMIWTFAVIGWLEKLISLIIIFPIWMLGHVFPEGDGIVNGIGRQGYVLSANVLLRPPVQLLALHFAMAALGAIGFLLSHILEVFLPSSTNGYTTGFAVGLGSFIVMSGFIVVICHMVLAWIYKIPDEIPHYIGGGASNFGESEGKGQINAIAGVVSGQTQSGANSLMAKEKEKEKDGGEVGGQGNHGRKTKQKNKIGSMGV